MGTPTQIFVSPLSSDLQKRVYWFGGTLPDSPGSGTFYLINFNQVRICIDTSAQYVWFNVSSASGWSGWKKIQLT